MILLSSKGTYHEVKAHIFCLPPMGSGVRSIFTEMMNISVIIVNKRTKQIYYKSYYKVRTCGRSFIENI